MTPALDSRGGTRERFGFGRKPHGFRYILTHSSAALSPPTPMPGFVGNAVAIILRVGQDETKLARPQGEPVKRKGGSEAFFQGRIARRTEVDGPATMVLTVAGSGHPLKDAGQRLPGGEFPPDDFLLSGEAAKTGPRQQCNPVGDGRAL